MKKKDYENGIWRTVGGRRIFIRKGQDLSSAMKESGKFKNMRKDVANNVKFKDMKEDTIKREGVTSEEYQRAENNVAQLKKEKNALQNEVREYDDDDMMRGSPAHDEVRGALQNKENELKEAQKKYDNLMKKDGHLERKYKMPIDKEKNDYINKNKQYEEMKKRVNEQYEKDIEDARMTGNDKLEESAKKARAEQLRDIDRMQKENRKEYDAYKGTKYERQYDSVEDRYNRDKDFRDRLKDIDKKYNDDKLMSKEEYESYASRLSDRDDYARTSYQDYIEETKNVGSIKQVNDSIRNYDGYNKKIKEDDRISNGMTKEEYKQGKYVFEREKEDYEDILNRYSEDYGYDGKDRLSNLKGQIDYMRNPRESINQTAQRLVEGGDFLIYNGDVQDYLTKRGIKFNEDNFFDKYKVDMANKIEKLYNQADLKDRYSGTVDYLQKTTNMSSSEILELLKKIDEDKK